MSALRPGPSRGPFRPCAEAELVRSSDEELLAYAGRAHRAGADEHAETAMFLMMYRHENRMRRRIQNLIPRHLGHHSEIVEEWVLERVWKSALKLQLTGESVGEFVNWSKTAIARQVISFFRSSQGQSLAQEEPWPDERPDDESGVRRARDLGWEPDMDALARSLDYRAALDAALAGLNPRHRAIVEAAYLDDLPSKQVAEQLGETVANVDQVNKRFRVELREQLQALGVPRS
jgi:RNA polymerase sigma factor (sigma-70 family)